MDVTAATENTQNPDEALTAFRKELAGLLKSERFHRRDDALLAGYLTQQLA